MCVVGPAREHRVGADELHLLTHRELAAAAATLGRSRDAAALDILRATETDAGIASGAKLETFLYLDRTFGFSLVAHLAGGGGPAGKPRR
jgi:hypothetical protein